MLTDYHSHILPAMDDGSRNVEMSLEMLRLLEQQGIGCVCATPHYHRHRKTVAEFLEKRRRCHEALAEAYQGIPILLGAEVALERGLSEEEDLPRLTYEGSSHILIEMPYSPYKSWMIEEIYNIAFRFHLVPVIAHIDRCLGWYSKTEIAELLAIRGAVFQINCESFLDRKALKFVVNLIRQGYPLVFGTDCHNLEDRAPNRNLMEKFLKKKLSELEWKSAIEKNEELLN